MISRFQVDAISLAETQMKLALLLHTFSIRNKMFKDRELVEILTYNRQEHIETRHQGRVFIGIIGSTTCATVSTCSNTEELDR